LSIFWVYDLNGFNRSAGEQNGLLAIRFFGLVSWTWLDFWRLRLDQWKSGKGFLGRRILARYLTSLEID